MIKTRCKRLRAFLGLHGDDQSDSRNVFSNGIGWYTNLGGCISLEIGTGGKSGMFSIKVINNYDSWRKKFDTMTSNA